jgi:predicted metal-dependent phosphoesterase TrpH
MKYADLQLHTIYSDGTFTPSELVVHAKDAGLDCIALTDHDTVDGVAETARLCGEEGLEFIPGVELTAYIGEFPEDENAREIHILGYLVDCSNKGFLGYLRKFKEARDTRVDEMLLKLKNLGIDLERKQVEKLAEEHGALGRLHVARALKDAGFVQSPDEAFARYLSKGRPAWAPKFRISVREVAAIIHGAGGAAIFAHPGLAHIDPRIPRLLQEGLDGIEVWHSAHTPPQAQRYQKLAEQLGCLITGGSDCHGLAKDTIVIGTVKLPYPYVERLKEFVAQKKL